MFLAVIGKVPLSLFNKIHESIYRITFLNGDVNIAYRKNAE